jgi:HD-like signal output (HDOD) protein
MMSVSSMQNYEQRINQLVATATGLPTLPGVAVQIITAVNDEDADVESLVRILQCDPALTAKILRVANSPIFGSRRGVESLQQAIVMLGMKAAHSLALSFSLISALKLQSTGALDYELYWRRCLLTANAAKQVAARIMPIDKEAVFLAALMQNLGMMVLDRVMPELYKILPCPQADDQALEAYELETCGVSHAIIGEWMAKEWGFSERMQSAAGYSHKLESLESAGSDRKFVCCVALGVKVADMMMSPPAECDLSAVCEYAAKWLDISDADVGVIVQALTQSIPAFERVFDTRLLDQEKLQIISDLAREKHAELRAAANH